MNVTPLPFWYLLFAKGVMALRAGTSDDLLYTRRDLRSYLIALNATHTIDADEYEALQCVVNDAARRVAEDKNVVTGEALA